MTQKGKRNLRPIIIVVAGLLGFFLVFQLYMAKDQKKAGDLLHHSFSVIEGTYEGEMHEYYISNEEETFNALIQAFGEATFKPTRATPEPPSYTVHIYDQSLEVATKLIVRENNQIEVNDVLYVVDRADTASFESSFFHEDYAYLLRDFEEVVTHMYGSIIKGMLISEQHSDWAIVIALARIAQDIDIDVSDLELLYDAPTVEVAEQMIHYGITSSSVEASPLIESIRKERYDVAEVLLENEIGLKYDLAGEFIVSPVAVAKLNEADEMVDVLLTYGFEDVHVDPAHIEAVQQRIDFTEGNTKEMTENLAQGQLPGLDIQLPTSTSAIIEQLGEYTSNELPSTLTYRHHSFYRLINLHRENKDRVDPDVFAYEYDFPQDRIIHQGEIEQILGEPNFIEENEYRIEVRYTFGEYYLYFILDLDGYVNYIHYYYEGDL